MSEWSRRLRGSQRAQQRIANASVRFRRAAESWPDARREAWVLDALRLAVRDAYRHTSYYRRLLDGAGFDPGADFGFDDFARLPVLEREDLQDAGGELLSEALPRAQLVRDATGGSTGIPTVVWRGPVERGWSEGALDYFARRLGLPPGTSTAFIWGHHLDLHERDTWRQRFYWWRLNARWYDCFRLSPDLLEAYHRELQRWRPSCIIAYATALGALAEHVLERGHSCRYPRRACVTGAEKLQPHHREAVRRAFGRPVHERYGGRDVGVLGYQLTPETSLDYTLDWPNLLVEPENGDPVSPILVTKLHADGMPMLRYRVGDVARFPAGARPGHPAYLLHEVVGRETDRVWLPDGRWISGNQFPHLLKDFPIREFAFLQREDYSTELRLVAKPDYSDESSQRIRALLAQNLPGIPLAIMLVAEIPRTRANKSRPVVSEVKAPPVPPAA